MIWFNDHDNSGPDALISNIGNSIEIREDKNAAAKSKMSGSVYTAPEQLVDKLEENKEKSSVFALGTIIYEIIKGKRLFQNLESYHNLNEKQMQLE